MTMTEHGLAGKKGFPLFGLIGDSLVGIEWPVGLLVCSVSWMPWNDVTT